MNEVLLKCFGAASFVSRKIGIRLVRLVIAAVYAAFVVACGGTSSRENCEPVVIGAVFPLTGELAGFGEASERGLRLAFPEGFETNGCTGVLRVEDGRGDSTASVTAYGRLRSATARVIVTNTSGVSLALASRARSDGIVLFADAAHPAITPPVTNDTAQPPVVFRHSSVADQEADVFVNAIRQVVGATVAPRVSMAVLNNEYGRAVLDAFRARFNRQSWGGAVELTEVRYDPNETEFSATARHLIQSKSDLTLLVGYSRPLGLLINAIRDRGSKVPIICSVGFLVTADAVSVAGANAEGIIFNAFYYDEGDQKLQTFRADYRKRYGAAPPQTAVLTYNTGLLIRAALERVPQLTTQALAAAVADMGKFSGAGEQITIRRNGDVLPDLRPATYSSKGLTWLARPQ
jgi:branched-chain amino acid transport system substrate-binding protein